MPNKNQSSLDVADGFRFEERIPEDPVPIKQHGIIEEPVSTINLKSQERSMTEVSIDSVVTLTSDFPKDKNKLQMISIPEEIKKTCVIDIPSLKNTTVPVEEEFLSLRAMCDYRPLYTINFWRQVCVEFLGSLLLQFFVGAAIVGTIVSGFPFPSLLIGFAHLPIIAVLIIAIGPISGGHINSLITLATMFTRLMSLPRGLIYIIAQLFGGIMGAFLLKTITSEKFTKQTKLGLCNFDTREISPIGAMIAEATFDFAIILMVFSVVFNPHCKKNFTLKEVAIIIGSAFGLLVWLSSNLNLGWAGASLNPVKCFAYSVVVSDFAHHWTFWVAPILASMLYGLIHNIISPFQNLF
ncbi:hypothetical protein G9A89_014152 [Geosiphon pyriformis]|nr:hypothetical protein G9A89_014152 [Geosiphon pyriformis]